MCNKQILRISVPLVFMIMVAIIIPQPNQDNTCTIEALLTVANGGTLHLADDCVLMLYQAVALTGQVTIEGGILHGSGFDRVLLVTSAADVRLSRVTIVSGSVETGPLHGGGILNYGNLHINHSTIVSNQAQEGGGIYNAGTLTLLNTKVARNNAREGGGIYNDGSLIIENSNLFSNRVQGDETYGGYGAGLVNKSSATIQRSRIENNQGDGEGIGIDTSGSLTIHDSIIMNNHCTQATCHTTGLLRFAGTVDARYNWWGSPDGPGDTIAGVAPENYTPWLKEPPTWAFRYRGV